MFRTICLVNAIVDGAADRFKTHFLSHAGGAFCLDQHVDDHRLKAGGIRLRLKAA